MYILVRILLLSLICFITNLTIYNNTLIANNNYFFCQIHNPQFDKEFLITLACLKSDDPRIYDEKVKFFSDIAKPGTSEDIEANEQGKKKSKKEKALFLRDYERKIMLERDGRFSSSEGEDDARQKAKYKTSTYVEEQKQLRDSFKQVLKDENEDSDDTDFLKIKQKTEEEKHKVFSYQLFF